MKKNFLAAFIVVCTFIMSMGIINASAETYGDLTYTVSNGEVTITDCNDSATLVDIPSTVDGYTVKSIGEWAFADCHGLTSITIPDSVTSIGDYAFYCCESLTSIAVPNGVTSIEEGTFCGCEGLTGITIPYGVTSIGDYAFSCCDALISITIPDGVTSIGREAFYDCESLTSITIPDSVTSIGDSAFIYCDNVEKVYYCGTEEEWNKFAVTQLDEAEIIFDYVIPSVETEIIKATSTATSLKFISKAIIEGEPEIATFGTTFIPLWLFEENSTDTATVEYNNEDYDIQNGQTFGATLTNIPDSFKDIKIVGKSYIKTADGNYEWSTAKYATVNDTALKTVE